MYTVYGAVGRGLQQYPAGRAAGVPKPIYRYIYVCIYIYLYPSIEKGDALEARGRRIDREAHPAPKADGCRGPIDAAKGGECKRPSSPLYTAVHRCTHLYTGGCVQLFRIRKPKNGPVHRIH